MQTTKTPVGIIGCGNISGIYFENMGKKLDNLEVVACADLQPGKAKAKAEQYPGVRAISVDELLKDPAIRIVVNLTIPKAHAEVALAAVAAGKSVYNEKPFTIRREDGKKLLSEAARCKVRTGCAPDTFLGGGIQTCRKLIDDGWIGKPVAATAFMTCHGHEGWHPDPEFYYQVGGGPLFDMGPYYLTALVNLLGPVRRVTGSAQKSFAQRTITSQPKKGKVIDVEVPTHIAAVLDFHSGAVATLITSFDVWAAELPRIEIYGSQGSLGVPDPNGFGGAIRLLRPGAKEWSLMPLSHGYAENARGVGVADMAKGLQSGRPHRACGELAYHVLDIMHAIHDASQSDKHVTLESTCERPAPLPMGLLDGMLDD
jgi:predicted dehydrogenase